jgi:[ribosomal protein S18]-alanine N-acetyltransferase
VSDESVPDIRIEPMRAADLEAVLQIERVSFHTPWSRQAFVHELERNRVAGLWVARGTRAGKPGAASVVGYLCLWAVADEVHVTNLAVHPAWRGEGIGRLLVGTLLAYHRGQGARRAFLEVRPGNAEARRLYEGLGFHEVGRRRGYYVDTGEDALLLEASLDTEIFSSGSAGAAGPKADRSAGRNPSAG